jgi:Holliday junction resolvase RusA-like endonuclease
MDKREKIEEKIKDREVVQELVKWYTENKEEISVDFVYPGQPENYVRERYTSRGKRFYNKKAKEMDDANKFYASQLDVLTRGRLQKLILNPDAEYYVKIDADFYLKTPDGDSIKKAVLKEEKIILPAIRPDLDNYDKFLIDVLHNIIFDDDKRVVSLKTDKYYSINPRTEVKITVIIMKE